MLSSKIESMKPLIESSNGIHLTVYIRNTGDLAEMKRQLRKAINIADEYLIPVMPTDELERFISPLVLLADDEKRLNKFSGDIGIFRTLTSFRVLNLPVSVQNTCIVADSFHVKPLLKWMQVDRDFLLLGVQPGVATLYQGDLYSFKVIDSVLLPDSIRKQGAQEMMEWLNTWILDLTTKVSPRLFIAGEGKVARIVFKHLRYKNVAPRLIWPSLVSEVCDEIRTIVKADARKTFERTLIEFHYASDVRLAKSNVFAIARAAVQGNVKKLLISEEFKIFGKLDRKNGTLSIHLKDLNHEDDDILDDLAQAVLSHGGEVIVAPQDEIPNGRPVLALVNEPGRIELEQPRVYEVQSNSYQERGNL
jgi:hypothetical protein